MEIKNGSICIVCEKGILKETNRSNIFNAGPNESVYVDDLEGFWCDVCQDHLISPDQLRRNHEKIDRKRTKKIAEAGTDV